MGCYSWHVPSYWEQQSSGSARHKGIVGVNTTICCAPASLWSVLPEYLLFCASAATEISSHLPMERTCPLISTGDDNSLACWQPMCVCVCQLWCCWRAFVPHTHGSYWSPTAFSAFPLTLPPLCRIMPSHNNQSWPGWMSFLKLWMIMFQSFVHQRGTRLQMKLLTWRMICRSWHHPESGCSSNLLWHLATYYTGTKVLETPAGFTFMGEESALSCEIVVFHISVS